MFNNILGRHHLVPLLSCLCTLLSASARESSPTRSIVMFGDSTTAPSSDIVSAIYPQRVRQAMKRANVPYRVINAGIPYDTTQEARRRFETDVLAHHPVLIVMQFGINDSAVDVWATPPKTQPRVPLSAYRENLRAMIQIARKADIPVILMTTNPLRWTSENRKRYGHPPYDPTDPLGFEKLHLVHYNQALRQLARELNLPLVDIHTAYPLWARHNHTTVKDLLPDGVHPDDRGHALVALILTPVILRHLP